MYVQVKNIRSWPYWLAISILLCLLVFSWIMLSCSASIRSLGHTAVKSGHTCGEDDHPRFSEKHSYGSGTNKVVRISFSGIITRESERGFFSMYTDPTDKLLRQIRAARKDADVRGILLEIDSPGGEITAADEIYHELMEFKRVKEDGRVVALIHDMAASGGYYIIAPADRIVAQPTSIIGSIGVIMQTYNIKALSEKLGITDTTIKSGKNKDMLNPFRDVDPAQVALLQESVDDMYARFLDIIATNRPIPLKKLKALADGRIFTSTQALEHKLIDQIGYRDDAMRVMEEVLDVPHIYVVTYERTKTFMEQLFEARMPDLSLQSILAEDNTPRRMAIWKP